MGQWRNQRKGKKYLYNNENRNIMVQNLWNSAKAVLKGKQIAIQVYLKKQGISQINNLTLHYLKELEKEEQTKPKVGRKKEVTIWVKINKIENKKTMQNINITKSWFLEKIKLTSLLLD